MPKSIRTPEEIKRVKEDILLAAVTLIGEKGFSTLSMRKLAASLGMTAANIYNYYQNKDELYLDIQKKGFEKIYEAFFTLLSEEKNLRGQIKGVVSEYIRFGTENPHWYNIIFSMDTPKYADYKDSSMEPTARKEKQAGLKLITLASAMLADTGYPEKKITRKIIHLWISMHGIVSLVNSRVLQEVEEDINSLVEEILTDLTDDILPEKNQDKEKNR